MLMRWRALWSSRTDDRGFTMTELLVVILLIGVVSSVALSGASSAMRVSTVTERRVVALTETQRAMERASRQIRASDAGAVTSGPSAALLGPLSADRLTTDADTGTDPAQRVRITYFVDASTGSRRLCEHRSPYQVGGSVPAVPNAPPCQNELVRDLEAGPAVFAYFTRAGAPLAAPVEPAEVGRVVLTLRRAVADSGPIEVSTSITLRNS
jgi:prepilin-type N-terminal cleavage/methylation domain-containing protein